MNYRFSFLFIFLFFSCNNLTHKVETLVVQTDENTVLLGDNTQGIETLGKISPYTDDDQLLYNQSYKIWMEDQNVREFYNSLNPQIINKKNTWKKNVLLYLLSEMNRRPDLYTDKTQMLVLIHSHELHLRHQIFSINPKKNHFLSQLLFLLKINQSEFKNILNEFNRIMPQRIPVSKELNTFLLKYETEIKNNLLLNKKFIIGDEIIREPETFERDKTLFNFKINSDELIEISENFSSKINPDDVNCSSRIKNYYNDTPITFFGIQNKENYIIILSNNNISHPITTDFSKATQNLNDQFPIQACLFKSNQLNNNDNKNILLFSLLPNQGMQVIEELTEYGYFKGQSMEQFVEYFKLPRYLILENPKRILYESLLASKRQLNYFLNQEMAPVYHVPQIGNLMSIIKLTHEPIPHIILDPRTKIQALFIK